jgi:thiol-disulfide isomerase/thioredoxin
MDSVNNDMNAVKGMLFNKKFIIILVVTAIFIGVAFWVYTTYVAPSINPDYVPNREFTDGEGSNTADLFMFSVDWCPYSKAAKPVWKKLTDKYNGKEVNGTLLEVKEIDGDKQAQELENFESKYLNGKKIEGYPSIYIVKDDKVVEYEAKPKLDTLKEFINSVL